MPTKVFRIHPAIGIARVGDADRTQKDFFFIGPEVPGIPANFDTAKQSFRSFKLGGKVRPQAVRFRVFEFERSDDGQTKLIGETRLNERGVTAISWTVHVANRKASFVAFDGQKGIGDKPMFSKFKPTEVRNNKIEGVANRRQKLDLDPGEKSIAGGAKDKVELSIKSGPLDQLKKIKTLGELRSDPQGRLIFVGGSGQTERFSKDADELEDFANNNGWADDVSDGPVKAKITANGQTFDAQHAWVMTGPPDFVPAQPSYRTLYDTLVDLTARDATADGPFTVLSPPLQRFRNIWASKDAPAPVKPSFTLDIYPMLRAMSRLHRVHRNGRSGAGATPGQYHDMLGDAAYRKLGHKDDFDLESADAIFSQMRSPRLADRSTEREMPRVWGNEALVPDGKQKFHTVSELQYHMLRQWSKGNIEKDWAGAPPVANPQDITPDGLDQAALENATGGPFCPGIELGWLGTRAEAYESPLRFALGRTVGSFTVPGKTDAERTVTIEAGAFSQQMALPWQADFLACKREEQEQGAVAAAWWPVQRPDVVVQRGEKTYSIWARDIKTMEGLVDEWSTRGFVVQVDGDLFEVEGPDTPSV